MTPGYVSTAFHFRNNRRVFTEARFPNNSTGEASPDQALDHERFFNSQSSFRVFERDSTAYTGAGWRAINFTFGKDADIAAVGAGGCWITVDYRSVEKTEVVFERMLDLERIRDCPLD